MSSEPNCGSSAGWAQKSLRRHMAVVLGATFALVGGVGGWAATQQIASAIIAPGVVVVDDNVKKIQHLTGGNISEIRIREGQHVKAGETLIVLDGTRLRASLSIVEKLLAQLYTKRARLQAESLKEKTLSIPEELAGLPGAGDFIRMQQELLISRLDGMVTMVGQLKSRQLQLDEEIIGFSMQIKASEDTLVSINKELSTQEKLFAQKAVSSQRVLQLTRERSVYEGERGEQIAKRSQSKGKKDEIDLQLSNLHLSRQTEISNDLTDTQALIFENEEKRRASQDELNRLEIISPVDGRALQLAVHTTNGVVNPGQDLVVIVPDSQKLTVEARIQTRDIDQLQVGQPVRLRFTAFNQRTTPEADGVVTNIAADAVVDQATRLTYYPVRVEPTKKSVEKLGSLLLYPGMPAEVFANINDRTVVSYLMKPFTDQIQHAFREE